MGDRANIEVRGDGGSVFFYTHWTGSELPDVLQKALVRGRDRWRDPVYLARVIFCEMVRGDELSITGFGISPRAQDGRHRMIVVDVDAQEVRIQDQPARGFAEYADNGGMWTEDAP